MRPSNENITWWQGPAWKKQGPTIPHCNDEEPPTEVDYQNWSPETSRVVSGPLGPLAKFPGRRFANRREARKYWEAKGVRIIGDLSIPTRWIFRIPKEK